MTWRFKEASAATQGLSGLSGPVDMASPSPQKRLGAIAAHPINRALGWLKRHSFFSGAIAHGTWDTLPYPEITGYTIPTLRSWGEREWAFRAAIWLASIQMQNGGIEAPDGLVHVFDTAQALRGFLAVFPDLPYLESNIRRAAKYMIDQREEAGIFKNEYGGTIPEAIHLFALKPLFDAGTALAQPDFSEAACEILEEYRRSLGELEWKMQAHFWGYVLEGLLEMGERELVMGLSGDLLRYQNLDGSFPAYPGASWVDASGTAQFAGVLFRMGQSAAGTRAIQYLELVQSFSSGFLGSYGEGADYFPDREISWPVKFFLDAYRLKISAHFDESVDDPSIQSERVPEFEPRWQYLKTLLGDLSEKRVLEVGCGRGEYLRRLGQIYPRARLVGLEMSRAALQHVDDSVERIAGSILDIPMPDASCDVVYCIDVLHHSVRPTAAVREMCRVLRPGGQVLLIDKNEKSGRQQQFQRPSWERWFTAEELVEMLAEYCTDVHVQGHRWPGDGAEPTYLVWTGIRGSTQMLREDVAALAARVEALKATQERAFNMVQYVSAENHRLQEMAHQTGLEATRLQKQVERIRAEVAEKEQAVQALSAQVAEREQAVAAQGQAVQALNAQVAEREQAVAALQAQVAAQEQAVQALSAQVAEREQAQAALGAQVAEQEQAVQSLNAQVAEREQAQAALGAQVAEQEQAVRTISAQLAAKEARLEKITGSFAWRVLSHYGRIKYRYLLPLYRLLRLMPPAATAVRIASQTSTLETSVEPALPWREVPRPSAYDIIVFPIIDWEFRFQRPQQIAMGFARAGHRVFYVRTAFREHQKPTIRPIGERIFEVQLPGPSYVRLYSHTIDERLGAMLYDAFASLRQEFSIIEAVCFVDLPFWKPVALKLRRELGWKVVYDCMDHHPGFLNTAEAMLKEEDELSRASDLVVTSSRPLFAEQSQRSVNCLLVPNAADFDHFRFAHHLLPEELRHLGKPIVGYYGAISDWFDSELVHALAQARPQWKFVLIGRTIGANLAPLQDLENVHLLGEKPYAVLPPYLHAFDVCIIPFKKLPLTEATNPVKLFEFLSAGKPVVATDLTELRHYADHVELASTPEQWLLAIEKALQDHSPERVTAHVEFARHNTWDERVAQIKQHINSLFPRASIIVVTYNNLDYTRLCLESIYKKTVYPNYEVIVVDNASIDGTVEFLKTFGATHPNFAPIFNERNEGFASANNRGIAAATGEYMVFLNNDTIVPRGWLSGLINHLRDAQVGIVGPVTNFSGNESRIEVDYLTPDEMEGFAERYTRAHEGQTFEISMLALFCIAMRRSVVDEVGLLDERFGIGMFEDDDYALRVQQKGYKVICAEDVFVHHWGSASFSKLSQEEYQRLFDENRKKLEEKWGMQWEPHRYRSGPRES